MTGCSDYEQLHGTTQTDTVKSIKRTQPITAITAVIVTEIWRSQSCRTSPSKSATTHTHAPHTHARTHARTHTHTHTRTHARTHTHTHTRTHTHTHTQRALRAFHCLQSKIFSIAKHRINMSKTHVFSKFLSHLPYGDH